MARARSLNHPNVCTLHDVGSNNLAMEYVLKPGNILVNADGAVKVLDFGLAKLMQGPSFDPDDPTAQKPLTEAGIAMGTELWPGQTCAG